MALTANQVHGQISGAIAALEKLSAKEREQAPTVTFGENYNKLLTLAKQAMPAEDTNRWPSECPISPGAMGLPGTPRLRYSEIHSFMGETLAILNEGCVRSF